MSLCSRRFWDFAAARRRRSCSCIQDSVQKQSVPSNSWIVEASLKKVLQLAHFIRRYYHKFGKNVTLGLLQVRRVVAF